MRSCTGFDRLASLYGRGAGKRDFLQRLFCRWSYVAHRLHKIRKQSTDRAEYYEAARVYRPSAQKIIRIRCNAAEPEEKEQVISRCKIVTKRDCGLWKNL